MDTPQSKFESPRRTSYMKNPDAVIIEPRQQHSASIIWLHGLGADGHDFEAIVPELKLSDELGIRFIFPHAPKMPISINGGMSMRAWYDVRNPDLTLQEDSDSIKLSSRLIKTFVEHELDSGIVSNRIILAGFSQGGAIALYTGLRYSQPLAGILALSTYLPLLDNTASDINSANQSTSILQMHGQFDPIIPISTAKRTYELMQKLGLNIDWKDYPIPHSLCAPQIEVISSWIKQQLST